MAGNPYDRDYFGDPDQTATVNVEYDLTLAVRAESRSQRRRCTTPAVKATKNSAINMKNITLAISAASTGMPENPYIAARIAPTKQTTA
jgi:hypothetical protein